MGGASGDRRTWSRVEDKLLVMKQEPECGLLKTPPLPLLLKVLDRYLLSVWDRDVILKSFTSQPWRMALVLFEKVNSILACGQQGSGARKTMEAQGESCSYLNEKEE